MGRRSGFNYALRVLASSSASSQRAYNAEIRRSNNIAKQLVREQKALEREKSKQRKEDAIQFALEQTNEAEDQRNELISLLTNANIDPLQVKWKKLKKHDHYSVIQPEEPKLQSIPPAVDPSYFAPKINIFDKLFKKRIAQKTEKAENEFQIAKKNRDELIERLQKENDVIKANHKQVLDKWSATRNVFLKEQKEYNDSIDKLEESFNNQEEDAVEFYFNQVISLIDLPELIEIEWELEYNIDSKILIVDLILPSIGTIPTLKTKKYVATRQEYTHTEIKEKEIETIFEKMILQLSLRIVHDIYISDILNFVDTIVFNGIHEGINKSTGIEEVKCILSLQTKKDAFLKINIQNVDAKSCFLSFKGISGARLTELVPIAPIMNMNKEDKRFVQGIDIAHTIEGQNLASMDWEDFEHLIRELFEKEFAVNGAEVRITQASKDGGVDAIMFDPDPIRGGKFVIQAKRYTNVVGVSAVRDLFGTLTHEGASKGILVTTANYGADSYEFAKNKPLTLINGSNLLFLLEKHGYNARIDLEEAKKNNMMS